ncbi:acyl-CoA dehydrogenase family protein [Cryptosporangium aurantiacum]|uniref:Acyl-CoA dehydrogenase n=1 Tax=Cryptosporangium aurantiacum TaxID=134849 RepID=A0A1M7R442_9ACTN|nr:acyl-CoA dehydrogenase family protein [Cryptosporangium aurantiacum]SHN39674.1 acyl-CoA dehydrogenase [Cryptosporangium aurantiacum]
MQSTAFPHLEARKDVREAVRALCAKFPASYWEQHDREHEYARDFVEAFAAAGFLGILIPEEYGGGGGTIADFCAALEEVGASGGGLNACSSVHAPLLCVPSLLAFGTEEQRRTLLPRIASGDLLITFGVTEPDAGTDTTRISVSATRRGDSWLLNGQKTWNSGAPYAQKVMVLARTSEPGPTDRRGDGLTLFLADFDRPTVEVQPIPKIGRNAFASADVYFDDHVVGSADVLGEVGQGFYHLLHSLNAERLYLSAVAMGIGRWCLEAGTRYASERVVFDRPIGKNQSVQHPLAADYLHLLAAGQVLQTAIAACEEHGAAAIGSLANSAKYLTTEAAWKTADDVMQTFGGYSFAREYHIGRHWTEVRLQRIAPVNNQMVLNYIAQRVLDLPKSY